MTVADQVARTAARGLLRRIRGGRLTVIENGRSERFGNDGELEGSLVVLDPSLWRRALAGGGVGFGEAYVDGLWDSPDLVAALRVLARNLDRLNRLLRNPLTKLRAALDATLRRSAPTGAEDRRNISAHYDLGDEFFQLFLDPTMAYSCAVWDHEGMTLEDAQIAKFDAIARKIGLGPESNVVEIGTGWGGFATYAAKEYGSRVTTTTISERQFEHATALVARDGLQDRVTVLRQHYRDLRGCFTHLVSIEMIEAVDWRLYDEFFATIGRLLRPDGVAAIQAITVHDQEFDRSKHWVDFMKKHIFPGGCLPSVAAVLDTTRRVTDLTLVDLRDIGRHYVTTLRSWRESLDAKLDAARSLGFNDRFLRMWRYYFAACEAGFAERRISDVQMVFARPEWRVA